MRKEMRTLIWVARTRGARGLFRAISLGLARRLQASSVASPSGGAYAPSAGASSTETEVSTSLSAAQDLIAGWGEPFLIRSPATEKRSRKYSVAVIIPTHNDSDYLEQALMSLLIMSFQNWTCYIVDDGSLEDTSRFLNLDKRICVLRHASNRGLSEARNTGLLVSAEDLVLFLDADDLVAPKAVAGLVDVFIENAWDDGFAGVYGQIMQTTEETSVQDLETWPATTHERPNIDWLASRGDIPFAVHSVLSRANLLALAGGFDRNFRDGAEDYEFWDRLLRLGFWFRGSRLIVGAYRQRLGSMVRSRVLQHAAAARRVQERSLHPVQGDVFAPHTGVIPGLGEAIAQYQVAKRALLYLAMLNPESKEIARVPEDLSINLSGGIWWPSRLIEL